MGELTVLGFPVHRNGYVSKTVQAHMEMIAWEKSAADAPDQWLRTIIARYLKLFYLKRLDGHPCAETLPIVAESWVEDVGYNLTEDVDADRVQRGFAQLSRSISKWPQPVELIKAMPGRVVERREMRDESQPSSLIPHPSSDLAAEALDNILNMLNED